MRSFFNSNKEGHCPSYKLKSLMKISKIETFSLLIPDFDSAACSSAQDNLVVISGNHRVQAAKQANLKKCHAILIEGFVIEIYDSRRCHVKLIFEVTFFSAGPNSSSFA